MPHGEIETFLRQYAADDYARFHMPGHKGGLGFSHDQKSMAASWDITEIAGADNLLMPESIIRRAQQKAAEAFGAKHTFFLTCGSTAGLLAALLSLPKHSTVWVARDCHKSIVSGCVLADINAVFMESPYDEKMHRWGVWDAEAIESALVKRTPPAALIVTRPDYWGRCVDLRPIKALCRRHDMLLIVDEAHGAHFSFSDHLPNSASQYADIWVQSAHKTLAAWNQCAYLHMGERDVAYMPSEDRIRRALQWIHTTSPSYPMLEALERASQVDGNIWSAHIKRIQRWKASLSDDWQMRMRGRGQDRGVGEIDPTRLIIEAQTTGRTGYQLAEFLYERKIVVEMMDAQCVVLITTPSDPDEWYARLARALRDIPEYEKIDDASMQIWSDAPYTACERIMPIRDAALADVEIVPTEQAKGRICAQSAGLYPPGYALILPGERIDLQMIDYIEQSKALGAEPFGWPPLCVKEG